MVQRLILVRHGEALSEQADPARPLSPRGREQAARTADWLARLGWSVDELWHSGKARAEQTAGAIAGRCSPPPRVRAVDGLAPNDDPASVAERLDDAPGVLALVGHLPFLARLAGLLLAGDVNAAFVEFTEAGLAILRRKPPGWVLETVLGPDRM